MDEQRKETEAGEMIFFRIDDFWMHELAVAPNSGPCMICNKEPQMGDIWVVILSGTKRREGHRDCLDV
jgi:hypothetical protein